MRVTCSGVTTEIGGLQLTETGVFVVVGTVTWPGCRVTQAITDEYVGDVEVGSGTPTRCDYFPCIGEDVCLSGEHCDTDFDECVLNPP